MQNVLNFRRIQCLIFNRCFNKYDIARTVLLKVQHILQGGIYKPMLIDFHTHILPGIDDGSKNAQESLAMLHALQAASVDHVVLTPHFYAYQNTPKDFLVRRMESWNTLLPHIHQGMPRISLGTEVQYFEGIGHASELSSLRIEGTPYLLLEMPFRKWDDRMLDSVLELTVQPDTVVVLAHVERYFSAVSSESFSFLRENGVKMQMNLSVFDKWLSKRKATTMLKSGEIHILGTDCHNMANRKPNWAYLPQKAKYYLENSKDYCAICDTFRQVSII